jgi:hypothetical protein
MGTIVFEEARFWRLIALKPFRRTEGVAFDILPMEVIPRIDAVDRVIHAHDAVSPGSVGACARPWYVHTHQEDNLMVLAGQRTVDIYTVEHHRVESFVVTPQRVLKDGNVLYDGPAMLVWPCNVFHRIVSGASGSASINFAVRTPGFDINTAFNVYDLNTATGDYHVVREGRLDQSPS